MRPGCQARDRAGARRCRLHKELRDGSGEAGALPGLCGPSSLQALLLSAAASPLGRRRNLTPEVHVDVTGAWTPQPRLDPVGHSGNTAQRGTEADRYRAIDHRLRSRLAPPTCLKLHIGCQTERREFQPPCRSAWRRHSAVPATAAPRAAFGEGRRKHHLGSTSIGARRKSRRSPSRVSLRQPAIAMSSWLVSRRRADDGRLIGRARNRRKDRHGRAAGRPTPAQRRFRPALPSRCPRRAATQGEAA